jgi:hypothetical protein
MGTLVYGPASATFEFEDRALTHLRVAILSKLRRQESFALSFGRADADGRGRQTLWFHPAVVLCFIVADAPGPGVNRAWVEAITRSADNGEMRLVEEPPAAER